MTLSAQTVKTEEVISGEIADLDKQQRQAVMRESFTSRAWLRGYCEEAVTLLRRQLHAIRDEEPLKLLYIAQNQKAAKVAADMLNEVTKQDFSRLIISDEPGSIRRLRAAKRERKSCAIVAVQMVTEGFDCSHIATTAYASNRTAPLFIAQAMARNMRVTDTERAARRMLPAQHLIPDNPDIRKAFASALTDALHEVLPDDDCSRCGLPLPICVCPKPPGPGPRLPRYSLLGLDDPWLRSAVVLGHEDGETDGKQLQDQWIPVCADLGIPETYAPRVAVASRRVRVPVKIYAPPDEQAQSSPGNGVQRAPANPRDVNKGKREILTKAAGWMSGHIGHDSDYENVGAFQHAINRAAKIPYDEDGKGMRDSASPAQLEEAAAFAQAEITRHCEAEGCPLPRWMTGG